MERTTFLSRSPEETRRIGRALGAALDPVPRGGFVIALHGDLGAGKTVFSSGVVHGLGVEETRVIASPTFTVFRSYRGRVPIEHVDAYMVTTRAALEGAGLHEIGGNGHVACVEWAEHIADALPMDRLDVDLTPQPDPTTADPLHSGEPPRSIHARAGGPTSARVLSRWVACVGARTETSP